MSKQPERLAIEDELDNESVTGRISNHTGRKAAQELRALRAQVERLQAAGQVVDVPVAKNWYCGNCRVPVPAPEVSRSGQVAAPAMVRMTTKQRADALDAAIFGCPTIAVVAAFSKGITAAMLAALPQPQPQSAQEDA